MKLAKKITTAVASLAIAASMSVSAFAAAATWESVVQCAKDCGVQDHNVQQLSNFLEKNSDKFTTEQYVGMCKAIEKTFNDVVFKYLDADTAASSLDNDARTALFKNMTEEDRQAILKALVDTGAEYGVKITTEKRATNDGYDVIVEFDGEKTPIDDNKPSPTGETANSAAAFVAACAIMLAGTGIVVVAKKNKEN
ncbi:MAG: LPXTG cell wall anchor domain-containing protein [Ruminococcus sp.]|nr:LPXTG cell wall anchor domain-containing protein [Ruminococcus sp.]